MSHELGILIFIFLVVVYADFKITRGNMNTKFNGIGLIPDVLNGKSLKPMQYRVLVPWLCKLFKGTREDYREYIGTYLMIRHVFILLSLFSCWIWFNVSLINPLLGISMMGLFYIFAALYDYTDVYIEVFFFSLAFSIMTINPEFGWLALLFIGFISGLNRETALFIPFTMMLCGYPLMELIPVTFFTVWGVITPMVKYGERKRYCPFFMFKGNYKKMVTLFKYKPPILLNDYIKFFIILVTVVSLYISTYFSIGLSPIDISMGILFVLLIVPSVWAEIRVFTPTMLVVIPMALRGI